ncbi:MAG: hypothetical protein ABI488_04315 [Polyangiaceae bacterium]
MTSYRRSPQKLNLERLSSPTSELNSFERAVLANSPSINIPPNAKAAVWAALAPQLITGQPAAPTPRAWAMRLAARAVSRTTSFAAPACIALGVLALVAIRRPSAQPVAAQPVAAQPVAVQPAVASLASPPALNLSSPVTPSAADPGAAAASEAPEASVHRVLRGARAASGSGFDLEREITLLAQARAQLRSGNARGAQATLAQMHSQFPDRALRQERQVLGILAQNAQGFGASARRSALAFVKAHPESPHDAQLQRLLEQP